MKNPSDFSKNSVAYPLHEDEFRDIDATTKKKLLRLMARISESSYRRGFQHGGLKWRTVDPVHLRFEISLDKSPLTDVVGKDGKWVCSNDKSIDRLEIEFGELCVLGFRFHVQDKNS